MEEWRGWGSAPHSNPWPTTLYTPAVPQADLFVLIVDDSAVQRGILEDVLLEIAPHAHIQTADSAQAALQRLAFPPEPHLVFSDFNMPGMNGVLFLQQARQSGFGGKIYIVSTERSQELIEEALQAGATDWLFKPYTEETFRDILSAPPPDTATP